MGPTASGKSALALALAQETGAEIINADSMQVYRDLAVLTNRPTPPEEAKAPHRLYGYVDASARFSVGVWLPQARSAIEAAWALGRPVIVVGGTGLYFKALTEGLAPVAAAPQALRRKLLGELQQHGPAALHARLALRDPAGAARIAASDAPRILRGLEVLETVGRPLSVLNQAREGALPRERWIGLRLDPPPDLLRQRIEGRFAEMVRLGAVEEAASLATRSLDADMPILKAHGLPWLLAHLRGEMQLGEVAARAVADTRRYAKRQRTWMRGQMVGWPVIVADLLQARVDYALQQWRNIDESQRGKYS